MGNTIRPLALAFMALFLVYGLSSAARLIPDSAHNNGVVSTKGYAGAPARVFRYSFRGIHHKNHKTRHHCSSAGAGTAGQENEGRSRNGDDESGDEAASSRG